MRPAALVLSSLCILAGALPLSAQNVFIVTNASGDAGATVGVQVLVNTVEAADGWSFGLCHDPLNVTPVEALPGATTLTVNEGGEPDFLQINVLADGITMGAVVCITLCATLPAGTGHEILDVTYELIGVPDVDPIVTDLCFCETLGDPPTDNVLVVAGGTSIIPDTVCGQITIIPPPDYCLDLICEGGPTSAVLSWGICSPFDYFLLHRDGELLGMLDAIEVEFLDDNLAPGTYHYALIGVAFPEPAGPPVILVAECDADIIPVTIESVAPAVGIYLGGTGVTITGTGFLAAPDTTVEFGVQTALDIQVIDDTSLTCVTPAVSSLGAVDVRVSNSLGEDTALGAFLYGFIRGDVNEDQTIDLADVISTLTLLFLGGDPPFCPDAVDVNDDGALDIADAIYSISFLFLSGVPPEEPFTEPGLDPTDDNLGCGL
ncbi:MAG: IPT/TIG domain-containing protein [Planctomycetota bacterium]